MDGLTRRATFGALAAPILLANNQPSSGFSGQISPFDKQIAALRAARAAGGATLNESDNSPARPLRVTGRFIGGLHLDGANKIVTPPASGIDGMFVGNVTGSVADQYYNNFRFRAFNLVGLGTSGGASGLDINAGADMSFDNFQIRNFETGILLDGAIACSFYNPTIRENGIGVLAKPFPGTTGIGAMGPNANSFFAPRILQNDRGIDYQYSANTAINFFGGNLEANNLKGGNHSDGAKVFSFERAGHINAFGVHSESNGGEVGWWYSGADATKKFLMVGCEVIDGTGTLVYIDKGSFCSIANRIDNGGAVNRTYFNAGTSGTLIDTETSPSGDLSHVVGLRYGRLAFGGNPAPGSPPIDIGPDAISASGNVAINIRADVSALRVMNAVGKRIGYIQFGPDDHTLNNDAAGGWVFRASSQPRLFVGRHGAPTVESGIDNGVSLGSAQMRFSHVFAATPAISTSDGRHKQQVRALSDQERAVAQRCKGLLRAFKFNDAVDAKGDGARVHFGVVAQEVVAAFATEGLDATDYALLCRDQIEGKGDRYGVRYEELLAFMIAAI